MASGKTFFFYVYTFLYIMYLMFVVLIQFEYMKRDSPTALLGFSVSFFYSSILLK